MIRVLIYNEFQHERTEEKIRAIYPKGIHEELKKQLECDDISVKSFILDNVCDITDQVLNDTDVIIWWGHMAHSKVPDEVAIRVQKAVLCGMGAIFLHSAHFSKPFRLLMGTECNLTWRESEDRELVWVCDPSHPIARGIERFINLEHEETYGEPFGIPEPDKLVFIGSYSGGEAFRAGCCYRRGNGKVFYFQPGHEAYPTYKNPDVVRVIKNAVEWAKPEYRVDKLKCPHVSKPLGE